MNKSLTKSFKKETALLNGNGLRLKMYRYVLGGSCGSPWDGVKPGERYFYKIAGMRTRLLLDVISGWF